MGVWLWLRFEILSVTWEAAPKKQREGFKRGKEKVYKI
jgi:hypothetical protein